MQRFRVSASKGFLSGQASKRACWLAMAPIQCRTSVRIAMWHARNEPLSSLAAAYTRRSQCAVRQLSARAQSLLAKAKPWLARSEGASGLAAATFFRAAFSSLEPPSEKAPTTLPSRTQ